MMTAMDPRKVPAAVLRSGRIELWLETRLPDAVVRAAILERWNGGELPGSDQLDYSSLAQMTDGFTQADLRRIHADARALFLADKARGKPTATAQKYLARSIEAVITTRADMAVNLADDSLRIRTTTSDWKKMKGIAGQA
jgi:ATP-dependent 26S proteasome regulatory subunit